MNNQRFIKKGTPVFGPFSTKIEILAYFSEDFHAANSIKVKSDDTLLGVNTIQGEKPYQIQFTNESEIIWSDTHNHWFTYLGQVDLVNVPFLIVNRMDGYYSKYMALCVLMEDQTFMDLFESDPNDHGKVAYLKDKYRSLLE